MNENALRARMALAGMSAKEMCDKTGIGTSAFYRKIAGRTEFTQREISAISRVLGLNHDELCEIFFTEKVS